MEVRIGRATGEDLEAIVKLAPRLHEFGPPPFRPIDRMNAGVIAGLREGIEDRPEGSPLRVADEAGRIAGFIYLVTTSDFFTKEKHGHVSDLVVAREGRASAARSWRAKRGRANAATASFRSRSSATTSVRSGCTRGSATGRIRSGCRD